MNEREKKRSLPDWLREKLSDSQRFVLLCVLVGLLCGLVAVMFHLAIHHLFEAVWELAQSSGPVNFACVLLLAPTSAGLIVGLGVKFFAPEVAGSGIPQTKAAYYNEGGRIRLRTGVWRFFMGALYIGMGNSLGREGPTVHISTAISSRVGRWAFRDPTRVQSMAPVGMAAGIAAAFNAPLAALTFVFEELLDQFSMKALGGMVVAVVVAAAVSRTLLGEEPVFGARIAEDFVTSAWMLVALPMGLAAGLLGHAFSRGTLGMRGWFNRNRMLPSWLRPATGGLACGVLGLTGWYVTAHFGDARHSVFSIGYDSLEQAFENSLVVPILVALLGLKFVAVILNYATGGSGGLFSPTLFLGGMLGGLVGAALANVHHLGDWIPQFPADDKVIGGCVLLGMGAMFAAVVRCPFTSLIIIFEMTGNYSLILPLMAGNMLAWQVARSLLPVGIYNALLLQDGVTLRRLPAYRGAQDYGKLPVKAIMTPEAFRLSLDETCQTALKRLKSARAVYHAYPVVDEMGGLVGVITRHELEENEPEATIGSQLKAEKPLVVTTETSIRDAANRMIARDYQQVPVVSPGDERKLLGWLTLNDVARQQNAVDG